MMTNIVESFLWRKFSQFTSVAAARSRSQPLRILGDLDFKVLFVDCHKCCPIVAASIIERGGTNRILSGEQIAFNCRFRGDKKDTIRPCIDIRRRMRR